jgi:acyl-CoA reductase-like NAD-dependent aldehyde dehydrogenase
MMEGKSAETGLFYSQPPPHTGECCIVLGAGNVGMLSVADTLHWMFIQGAVVVLKHSPVKAFNHKWLTQLFAPLIDLGFFGSVLGDVEVSQALVYAPSCDRVHLTGGVATHDAIVWGVGPEAQQRRAAGQPLLKVPMTSELGACTPWLIVPGNWSKEEMKHHTAHLATCTWYNQSCACNAPKIILLDETWPQAQEFIDAVCNELSDLPPRLSYYPGTAARYDAYKAAYPAARAVASAKHAAPPGYLPWLVADLNEHSALAQPHALQVEAFAPVLTFVRLAGNMLDDGVKFANDRLMGTLSCSLLMSTADMHARSEELEAALAHLRYGLVGLNCWTAEAYSFNTATWGAYPGETLDRVSSGIGIVRNFLMFKHACKTVVRAPFVSDGHIGTSAAPLDISQAQTIVSLSTQLFFVTNAVPRAVKSVWQAFKSMF